jgi:MoxR-like ATPase
VTIAGQHRRLGPPFHVLATQNPIEQEGTYPLPEAQLDRFLVQVDVAYPTRAAERDILMATTGAQVSQAVALLSAADLIAAQALIRQMPVGERVVEAILDLVRACRPDQAEGAALQGTLAWGPGPRAAQALMLMVRARALLQGRLAPAVADVRALAQPVLGHRMALTFAARARGDSLAHVIAATCDRVLPA